MPEGKTPLCSIRILLLWCLNTIQIESHLKIIKIDKSTHFSSPFNHHLNHHLITIKPLLNPIKSPWNNYKTTIKPPLNHYLMMIKAPIFHHHSPGAASGLGSCGDVFLAEKIPTWIREQIFPQGTGAPPDCGGRSWCRHYITRTNIYIYIKYYVYIYIYVYVYIGSCPLLELHGVGGGVGWGGMLTFMWPCVRMLTFMWTCGSSGCYAHAGWGVGWGGMLTFMWPCGRMLTFMWTGQVLPT